MFNWYLSEMRKYFWTSNHIKKRLLGESIHSHSEKDMAHKASTSCQIHSFNNSVCFIDISSRNIFYNRILMWIKYLVNFECWAVSSEDIRISLTLHLPSASAEIYSDSAKRNNDKVENSSHEEFRLFGLLQTKMLTVRLIHIRQKERGQAYMPLNYYFNI